MGEDVQREKIIGVPFNKNKYGQTIEVTFRFLTLVLCKIHTKKFHIVYEQLAWVCLHQETNSCMTLDVVVLQFNFKLIDSTYENIYIKEWNRDIHMSLFSYACKTEGENGISRLISALCVNCLSAILEYSRIIDYSIIWMCIWCGLLQKLHKIKKSELLNNKVSFKL